MCIKNDVRWVKITGGIVILLFAFLFSGCTCIGHDFSTDEQERSTSNSTVLYIPEGKGFVMRYPIQAERVIDGDTFVANINLGFDQVMLHRKIRLLDVDAWEKSDPLGPKATEFSRQFLMVDEPIYLITDCKQDSFGRILGEVENNCYVSLNDSLTSHGLVSPDSKWQK